MELIVIGARLLLAAVFGVAALAKLADRDDSRVLVDFGVPRVLARPLGAVLPFAELAVALALLPAATAWAGAVGALALLLAFIGGMGVSLARGRRPECRCFGRLHSERIGARTVARNVLLAAGAAFVVARGPQGSGPDALAWLGATEQGIRPLDLVVIAVIAILAWLLGQLLQQHGRLLLRIEALESRLGGAAAALLQPAEGLPVGTPAPAFELPDLDGRRVTLESLRQRGTPVVLLFTDPDCGPCTTLMPEIGRWQREHANELTLAVISRGIVAANHLKAGEHGLAHVLLQRDYEVADSYDARGTPSAVLVRSDGTIGGPVAAGIDAVRSLVEHAIGPSRSQPWTADPRLPLLGPHDHAQGGSRGPIPDIGDPAPMLTLPNLEGEPVSLADFRGERTLVLFWNPGCGYCEGMLPDLQAWEREPPAGAPTLVVVSTGSAEATRAQGLRSPVLVDQEHAGERLFGAMGTPMAMLIDADGAVASALAVGAESVLRLAGYEASRSVSRAP